MNPSMVYRNRKIKMARSVKDLAVFAIRQLSDQVRRSPTTKIDVFYSGFVVNLSGVADRILKEIEKKIKKIV